MPVRKIAKSYRNVTGIVAAAKAAGPAQFESTLERDFLTRLEFSPYVRSFEVQPVTLSWRDGGRARRYTPDVLVHFKARHGTEPTPLLCEVKYRSDLREQWLDLKPKFRAAVRFAKAQGWRFKLVTEADIRTPYLDNARFLLPFVRRGPPPADDMDVLDHALCELGEADAQTLLEAACRDEWNRARLLPALWYLVGTFHFGADFERITDHVQPHLEQGMNSTPATFAVQPGTEVLVGQRRGTVTRVLDLDAVLIRDSETGQVRQARLAELQPAMPSAALASPGLEDMADEGLADGATQAGRHPPAGYANAAALVSKSAQRAREFDLHPNTLYKWLTAYEATGRLTALMPKTRRDKGAPKLAAKIETIIQASIEDVYLTSQRKPVSRVCDDVRRRCLNAGLEPPHANTIRNRIAQLAEPLRTKRREGRKAASEAFSPIEGEFPGADWPLAVVQIDHTKLDIILVDDHHRRPIGRPWITLAIDVFSRMVAGFYVSFDPPGALATGLCVAHAVLPKEQWLAKRDIDAEWPVWGFPKTLHMDNAKEFRGLMLQRACAEYGIDIDWRPVARPHFGGHIERLLGTASKEIHTLPGTTFSNPKQRGSYDSEGKAALSLSEFEAWLAVYVAQVYHQRKHSSLGMSPLAKYREGVFGTEQRPGAGLPARIADEDRLRLDFTPFVERTVQDYGVVIDDVHYYHDVLRRWIGAKDQASPKTKRKFVFRRDPRDISTIWFFDPELRTYYPIPYRDTSHPAISLWELREAERMVKQAGNAPDERALFKAYDRMRTIEEDAQAKTKAVRRAQQRRRDGLGAEKPSMATGPVVETAIAPEAIEPFDELDPLSEGHV